MTWSGPGGSTRRRNRPIRVDAMNPQSDGLRVSGCPSNGIRIAGRHPERPGRYDRSRNGVRQGPEVRVFRSGRSGSRRGSGRGGRSGPDGVALILGLVALVSLGAASQAPADHTADHVAAVPMIAQAVSREGALAAVQPTDAAQKAQSPAAEGFAKTSPALARLLGLGEGIVIGDSNEDEFLDPDVAFVLRAAAGPGAIEARVGHRRGLLPLPGTSSGSAPRTVPAHRSAKPASRRGRSRTTSTSGRWRCTTAPWRPGFPSPAPPPAA